MNEITKHKISHNYQRCKASIKWVLFSIIVGLSVGSCGSIFYYCMTYVTNFRLKNPWLIFFLPLSGLLIIGIYHLFKDDKDPGTNLVLSAIHSGDNLPVKMAPLIFISTIITHLFGGSAGREGAALQMGGSLGNGIGELFHFDNDDCHIMIMCGMSAAFSALFGTPMAAAIFSIEVVSVGIMHYSALVPCVISSLVANAVALQMGIVPHGYKIHVITYNLPNVITCCIIAILTALVSMLFCVTLHFSGGFFSKHIKNPYIRIMTGGCAVTLLTLILHTTEYNGTGIAAINRALQGDVHSYTFLLKIIFTAFTLSCGFKGGEIVPSFFIGATFGSFVGMLAGVNPSFGAAIGMASCFCGVTNCPISSLLISFELFGYKGMPFYLLSVALSYMFSGYFGLYTSQKIIYSKYKTNFINRKTL